MTDQVLPIYPAGGCGGVAWHPGLAASDAVGGTRLSWTIWPWSICVLSSSNAIHSLVSKAPRMSLV